MNKNNDMLRLPIVYPLDMIQRSLHEIINAVRSRLPATLETRDLIDSLVARSLKITDRIFYYDPIKGTVSNFITPAFEVHLQLGKSQSNLIDLEEPYVSVGMAVSNPVGTIERSMDIIMELSIFTDELVQTISGIREDYGEIIANQVAYKIFIGVEIMTTIFFPMVIMLETSNIAQQLLKSCPSDQSPIDLDFDNDDDGYAIFSDIVINQILTNRIENTILLTTIWNNVMNLTNPIKIPVDDTGIFDLISFHPVITMCDNKEGGTSFNLNKVTIIRTTVNPEEHV